MGFVERASENSGAGKGGFIAATILRFFQFLGSLISLGIYSQFIGKSAEHAATHTADSHYIFAVVIAGLASFTALVYLCTPQFFRQYKLFGLDAFYFFLYLILFGMFGHRLIGKPNPTNNNDLNQLKNSVWIDMHNMVLWFVTAVYGCIVFFMSRKAAKQNPKEEA